MGTKKLTAIVLAMTFVVATAVRAEEPVYIPDVNLKAAIEDELGIPDPTPTDMLGLTNLTVDRGGIADLTGLESAINLTGLELHDNQISDISALSGLIKLTRLGLYNNQISDISALSGMTNLTWLILSHNQISDISALSGLTSLQVLTLTSNQISDISVLSGLTDLTTLYLPANRIGDISALSGLTSLAFLHLSWNQINDVSALSGLTNLKWLYLASNQISDISALSSLINLIYLDLASSQISDISALSGMTKLTDLSLVDNQISDVSALSGITKLTRLILSINLIGDISALSGLANLTELNLGNNQISDISVLSGMTELKWLALHYNLVGDISALSGLSNLTILVLYNNQISDISVLSGLANLTLLDMRVNPLDCPAYNFYIPEIEADNPGIDMRYDPMPSECLDQPPASDAGEDQTVAAGDTVYLDGTQSWDPEGDDLGFDWSFISVPAGSLAEISDPQANQTSFLADLVGTYEVSLVVNDGILDSDPDTVIIIAISPEEAAEETLIYTEEIIAELPEESLKNKNSGKALINKIDGTLAMIEDALYEEALDKLENDILKKTDGCAETGAPDKNDWIVTCDEQEQVYSRVSRTIELLMRLVPSSP